jgi:hypothetical protein
LHLESLTLGVMQATKRRSPALPVGPQTRTKRTLFYSDSPLPCSEVGRTSSAAAAGPRVSSFDDSLFASSFRGAVIGNDAILLSVVVLISFFFQVF